jgi:hypothetical protein
MTRESREQGPLAVPRPSGHSELAARRNRKILRVPASSMLELLFYITSELSGAALAPSGGGPKGRNVLEQFVRQELRKFPARALDAFLRLA